VPSRRHALRLVAVGLLGGLAGCGESEQVYDKPGTGWSPTPTPDDPETPTGARPETTDSATPADERTAATDTDTPAADVTLTPDDLTLSGTVEQALTAGPPRISLRLTNDAGAALHYFSRVPLPMDVITNEPGDDHSAYLIPDDPEAALDPALDDENWDSVVPESPRDGCWQGPPAIVIGGVSGGGVFDAGASVTETYTMLDAAGDGVCFAPGEYTFQQDATVNVRGRSTSLDCRLRVVLRVTGGRTVELAQTTVQAREQTDED
jgi:hypothetical protein